MPTRAEFRRAAAVHGLGRCRRVHRERHSWGMPRVRYAVIGAVAGVALFAPVLPDFALLLGVGAAILIPVHVYAGEIDAPVGRRWIGVCEHGLLILAEHDRARALRWKRVRTTLRVSGVRGRDDGGVSWSETVYYPPYLVEGAEDSGRDLVVPVTAVGGRRALVAAVEDAVAPGMLLRARAALDATGTAVFGPVEVHAGGLVVRAGGSAYELGWAAFSVVGDRIVPEPGFAGHDREDRVRLAAIPTSEALLRLVGELRAAVR